MILILYTISIRLGSKRIIPALKPIPQKGECFTVRDHQDYRS